MTAARSSKLTPVAGGKSAKKTGQTLFERAYDLQLQVNALTAALENVKEEIRLSNPLGTHTEAGITVRLSATKTFDKEKARQLYGDQVCELVPTVAAAKEHLTGAQVDQLYKLGKQSVTIVVDK